MHSSRMRTGRALTVSGGCASQQDFFGGERNWKKKKEKNFRHPPKISDTPPENFRPDNHCHPPENFRPDTPPEISDPPQKFQTAPENFRPDTPSKFQTRHPPSWDEARYPLPPHPCG